MTTRPYGDRQRDLSRPGELARAINDFAKRDAEDTARLAKQQSDERAEAEAENAKARKAHLARLETDRAADRAKTQAARDAELAPIMARKRLEWFVAHPDKSEDDWQRAKPYVQELLDSHEARVAAEVDAVRRR